MRNTRLAATGLHVDFGIYCLRNVLDDIIQRGEIGSSGHDAEQVRMERVIDNPAVVKLNGTLTGVGLLTEFVGYRYGGRHSGDKTIPELGLGENPECGIGQFPVQIGCIVQYPEK